MSQVQEKAKGAKSAQGAVPDGVRDALEMLKEDHKKAADLFARFERIKASGSPDEKAGVANSVCGVLLAHMAVEEAILYPALRMALDEDDMMNEAEIEHETAKNLIRKIGGMRTGAHELNAAMKALSEYIEHHVKEEESEMFPKARASGVDLMEMGAQIQDAMMEMAANQMGSEAYDKTRS